MSLLACFWNFSQLRNHTLSASELENGLSGHSSHQSNVDKLINIRTKDTDDEVTHRNYVILLNTIKRKELI